MERSPSRARSVSQARSRSGAAGSLDAIDQVHERLDSLPIDSLLTLRDNLEELLASPRIDPAEVNRVIATVGT